jgi:tellurite methyltransferase
MPEKPDWQEYYRNTKEKPPSGLLVRALEFIRKRDAALDLGSGALSDSRFLLKEHFLSVVAVDKEQPPSELLQSMQDDRFRFIQAGFEEYVFPKDTFDLVNAQYSLPFASPESFNGVWNGLTESLVVDGIFTGQFFGIEDEWNLPGKGMTFHDGEQVHELLSRFETMDLRERKWQGKLADGRPKVWHVFDVIAKKAR